MKQKQILEEQAQQEPKIISGVILGFGYNTISLREDNSKNTRVIHFDGLQKRVLSDIDEELLKRVKRIEFTDSEDFWNIGINLLVCCDKCKNPLFSICVENDFNDKNICGDCDRWVCSDCFNYNKKVCSRCFRKRIINNLTERGLKN